MSATGRPAGFTLIEILLVIVIILLLAGALVVFVIPQQKGAEKNTTALLLKNVAIAGGFLVLVARGAGAWSLDARRERLTAPGSATSARI
jgi:putative oxidoreductase